MLTAARINSAVYRVNTIPGHGSQFPKHWPRPSRVLLSTVARRNVHSDSTSGQPGELPASGQGRLTCTAWHTFSGHHMLM